MNNYCTLCHKQLKEKEETIRFIDNQRYVLCSECSEKQLQNKIASPFNRIIIPR